MESAINVRSNSLSFKAMIFLFMTFRGLIIALVRERAKLLTKSKLTIFYTSLQSIITRKSVPSRA